MEREQFFRPEKQGESIVDLSEIKKIYISDEEIDVYYVDEIKKLENKEEWIEKNKQEISQESIARAFRDGIISEENIGAAWQYIFNCKLGEVEKIKELRNKIEVELNDTIKEVSLRLAKFIPDWKPEGITINFTINEDADFCNDSEGKNIMIDLARLTMRDNSKEDLISGITHELVHCWMKENRIKERLTEKEDMVYGIVQEGLTTYIAGNYLQKHHRKNDAEYEEFKKESIALFKELLLAGDDADLKKYNEGFKDMGFCYVAGNEIVKAVVGKIGIEKFKELLPEIRKDVKVLIEEYNKI